MEQTSHSQSADTPVSPFILVSPVTPVSENHPQNIESMEAPSSNATSTNAPSTQKKKVPSNKTNRSESDVWDHFTKNQSDPSNPIAICNYCEKDYAGGTRKRGTSTLRYRVQFFMIE